MALSFAINANDGRIWSLHCENAHIDWKKNLLWIISKFEQKSKTMFSQSNCIHSYVCVHERALSRWVASQLLLLLATTYPNDDDRNNSETEQTEVANARRKFNEHELTSSSDENEKRQMNTDRFGLHENDGNSDNTVGAIIISERERELLAQNKAKQKFENQPQFARIITLRESIQRKKD